VPFLGSPCGQVDRRLRVGRQHKQQLASAQLGHLPLGERKRQRAGEAARVERGHNAIVTEPPPPYALALVLATGDPPRMYSGLSLLVSTAAEGSRCAVLATFRGLELLVAPDLERRAVDSGDALLSPVGRETFARSLAELRDTALALDTIDVFACAASSETTLVETDLPVISTPRFLRETTGAQLLFV